MYLVTTYMRELALVRSPEVPVDGGLGDHLASHLAGDAAQFEALFGHGLRVRVHLHAGAAAQRRCRAERKEETRSETHGGSCSALGLVAAHGVREESRGGRRSLFMNPSLEEEPWCFLSALAGTCFNQYFRKQQQLL